MLFLQLKFAILGCMDPKRYQYTTELFTPGNGGVYAEFPFDVKKEFEIRGPVRVHCWINGHYRQCSLIPMGKGTYAIHVRKDIRKIIRKDVDDEVEITIVQDLSQRVLVIPDDFQWLLDDDEELKQKFERLSFSVRSGMIDYINQAKLPETRAKRIEKFIERIHH